MTKRQAKRFAYRHAAMLFESAAHDTQVYTENEADEPKVRAVFTELSYQFEVKAERLTETTRRAD